MSVRLISREALESLKHLRTNQIAEKLGFTVGAVCNAAKRYGIVLAGSTAEKRLKAVSNVTELTVAEARQLQKQGKERA